MEYLLEVRWNDPIAAVVARILSSVPEGAEQVTGQMPQGRGQAFGVYRSDSLEVLEGLARAVSRAGGLAQITSMAAQTTTGAARLSKWEGVGDMAKDPVCGMEVDEKKPAATAAYQVKTYFFCAPGCKATFVKAPEKYVATEKASHKGCA